MIYEKKSLLQMARGAFEEVFDAEMSKVLDNILDPNTKATAKRKLSLTFIFTPDDNRQTIGVSLNIKPSLEPTNPVVTSLYVTSDAGTGEVAAVEMVPNIPGQLTIDETEQEAPAVLHLRPSLGHQPHMLHKD